MPSSKKTVLKDLYKANSVSELNKMAEINTERSASLNLMCKSADKVFLKAQDFDMEHDEEMAYVFFMRYFNILTQIKKSPQYKKDKAHIDKLLGETKPKKAISQAEKLQSSLVKRYKERQKMKEDEELAKKLLARDAKKQEENQPNETKKQAKTSSVDDDLDNLLDGPAISSPSDVFQKLKVNHSSILTPEGSKLSNGYLDTNTIIPDLSRATPFLTAEQLYSLTKTVSPSDMLILDIRPMKEYTNNHILHDASINIPAEYLEHGVSVSNIDRRISETTRLIWCQRGMRNHVIILDKCSKVKDISPASRLYQFKDAIFRDDSSCTLRNEPLFLDGGFDDWLWHYPSLATKPELPKISSNTMLNETVDVSSLDFPKIPEEKKIEPTPPPVETQPSVNKREITEQNDMYPQLPDVKALHKKDGYPDRRYHPSKDGLDGTLQESQSEVSGHPTVPTSQPQIPGHPKIQESPGHPMIPVTQPQVTGTPMIPTSPRHPTVPNQSQVPGHQTIPTSQPGVPGRPTVPISQPGVPGHPTVPNQPQVPGHPTIPTSQPGVPRHPTVPTSQPGVPGHPTVPSQPQVPGHPTIPTSQPGVPRHPTVPTSQPGVPGHPTVPSQPQVPGHPTIPTSQPGAPGHPTVPTSQPQVPGQPRIPVSQPQAPGHSTVQVSQSGVPGHPTIPTSQPAAAGHSTVPTSQVYIAPSSQSQLPTSRNPPSFSSGQTVIPGQGGSTSVSQQRGVQGSEYKTTPGLPLGWEKCYDTSTNRVFYKDHNTHTTHWNPPNVVKPPTPSTPKQQSPMPQQPAMPQQTPIQQQSSVPGQQMSHPQSPITKQQIPQQQPQPQSSIPGQVSPQPSQPKPQTQIPKQQTPQQQQQLHSNMPKQEPAQSYRGELSSAGQAGKLKSGLRRSLSSPNLAKLEDDEPRVDRSSKPVEPVEPVIKRPAFNRNAKPITTYKLESLNPVHGGIGRGLTGLRNLGNTCYMNSVLQCLFSVAPLSAYFISGAFREDLNTKNPMGTRGELAEQFSMLVRVTHTGHYKSISPNDFKKTVGKIKPTFSGHDQQDSQEFLTLMMDKLHEDVNKVTKKPYLPAPEDDLDPRKAADIAWDNHKKRNESLMLQLFDGLFMSTVRCLTCGKESVTFETFSNLTLPLPAHRSHCSLKDCLELFTRPEKMSGDDKWFCPKCKYHREAVKRLEIWRLPPILIVHLKRFQYDSMWRQKLQTSVSFPLRDFDMSGYVKGPRSSSYHLFSVSNHYGTMHGGHYTAFCINSHDRQWYKFDDQLVSHISNPNSVVTSAGYLLFYTSLSFTPPKAF